jgi:CRP-like cAMP-binding protein
MIQSASFQPTNSLLAVLPSEIYQELAPHLEEISLVAKDVLYEPGEVIQYAYFPIQSTLSLVTVLENGSTVETGLVGHEGMLGIPMLLGLPVSPCRAVVQIAGRAFRIEAVQLKMAFDLGGTLQHLLLRYIQARLTQASQNAACNSQHPLEARLCRWLLSVQDSVQSQELAVTQETIAEMLGVRRSSVTVAARALQQAGMIDYKRGRITILSQEALEARSCECYLIIQHQFNWVTITNEF